MRNGWSACSDVFRRTGDSDSQSRLTARQKVKTAKRSGLTSTFSGKE